MQKQKRRTTFKARQLTVVGLLSGISIFLSLTPLGFIPILPINPTIMHVPVIIGAIIEGPMIGAFIGGIFGLSSMVRAFMTPTPTNFIFWNPIISIGVRILIGVVAGYVYRALKNRNYGVAVSAVAGSLTNTIGVLGLAFVFYLSRYAAGLGISEAAATTFILSIVGTNGVPEAIISALITVPVIAAYRKMKK
ncbi:ECF transporter S component [Proteiniclasticum sp. SCR006]|uniref:ECF transporter S component n=1 Tax=Proteiniclasticum aestuarii TaxID=2817862 RepID=A0A939HAS4_9CLOT|nr:ECF transporter S component [Proteiniclasticum aestuarii]MBO1265714.1 ECF transporter S component [Proteiniclasticum aestuarii]